MHYFAYNDNYCKLSSLAQHKSLCKSWYTLLYLLYSPYYSLYLLIYYRQYIIYYYNVANRNIFKINYFHIIYLLYYIL